jgi:hypothetical protein
VCIGHVLSPRRKDYARELPLDERFALAEGSAHVQLESCFRKDMSAMPPESNRALALFSGLLVNQEVVHGYGLVSEGNCFTKSGILTRSNARGSERR